MEQLTLSLAKAGTNCRLNAHDFPLDAANSVRVAVERKQDHRREHRIAVHPAVKARPDLHNAGPTS